MRIAAAVALLAVGAASGWLARGVQPAPDPARQFVQQAVGAHAVYVSEVRHPVEVRADEEAHLVTWLSNRLGQPIKAPKLQAVGFQLVGGRLLPDAGAPAAQFMYEDASGRRVMLYMRAGDLGAETAFRFAAERDVSAFYWIEGAFGYALTGKMPRDDLLELSRVVYEQLEKPAR